MPTSPAARIALLIGMALAAFGQSNSAEVRIRASRKASNEAIQRRDVQAFAASLAPDFVMIRGNGTMVPSRQEYIDVFTKDFADPQSVTYARIADKIEISNAAPVAAEHGHWIATRGNGKRAYGGTYLAMWRRTDADWKIRSELFVVLTCDDEAACAAYRTPSAK